MKLSVIIVSYNVEYFLEQCLNSVQNALSNISGEVIVVDNNSVDGSVKMVKDKFPEVFLIENQENVGFSKANNQAIERSSGEYILLLNPDTVVQEDTFKKTVEFMDGHSEAGGLGVKMIDGEGKYLPESKRGLPTPEVALYKIIGFTSMFPRSQKFSRYYLGHLNENEVNEVEVLAGAFMLLRKKALDTVGYLDEEYFMYGEDIDLSYRLIKAGYKNYYIPDTQIIHYKGESTKKSSINYVIVFYKAMAIFAKKHFSQKNARSFTFLINIAIYLRAALAIVYRLFQKTALPVFDILLMIGGSFIIKELYSELTGIHYDSQLVPAIISIYALIWFFSVLLSGGYDKPVKFQKLIKGTVLGTALILIGYSLLPEYLRFSRAITLFSGLWVIAMYLVSRQLIHKWSKKGYLHEGETGNKTVIVGNRSEVDRVRKYASTIKPSINFIGGISVDNKDEEWYLGNIKDLKEIIEVHKVDELIFCAKDVSSHEIIYQMNRLENKNVKYKIAPPESLFMIGDNSIETFGSLNIMEVNSISSAENRRAKRLFDIFISIVGLVFSPILIFLQKNKLNYLKNIFKVMFGRMTWVGYCEHKTSWRLPLLKKGVLSPCVGKSDDEVHKERMNLVYAKDYKLAVDFMVLVRNFKGLGS